MKQIFGFTIFLTNIEYKFETGEIHMRKLSLVISLCCILTLTACTSTYNLAEQEVDIVAETMAGILLKQDSNYVNQLLLLSDIELDKEMVETPTEEDEVISEDMAKKTNDTVDIKKTNDTADIKKAPVITDKEEHTISEVIGAEDFSIHYKGYELYNNYPNDTYSTYFSLTPREGNQLLVVSFTATNITNNTKNLNLIKSGIKYQLNLNETKKHVPLLTLLENDLQYINIPIGGDQTEEVILVFEIADEAVTTIDLNVSKDNKNMSIQIK